MKPYVYLEMLTDFAAILLLVVGAAFLAYW